MMKIFMKHKSAVLMLVVMVFYILLTNGLPFHHSDDKVGLSISIDKIMKDGPYHIEGEGMFILSNQSMSKMNHMPPIYFGIEGHLDYEKKDYEIQISLKDVYGYEEVPLGSYRGTGNTHVISSEIGTKETIDMSPFFDQASSKEITMDQVWQNIQKDIEVNRAWIKDTRKGYNPIKREVKTYTMDLGMVLSQGMMEGLNHLNLPTIMIEEALVSYHADRNGNPIALDFAIKTKQVDLEVLINIKKAI